MRRPAMCRAARAACWGWALCGALGWPAAARAGLTAEVLGVRTLSMGRAHRALGSSNEALWLNPAGMALTRRYHVDFLYGYGGASHVSWVQISAVDSKSGPVAGGVAYCRDWGNPSDLAPALNRFDGGAAYAIGDVLGVGVSAVNVRGSYRRDGAAREVDVYDGTAGISLALGEFVALGAAYQNILVTAEPDLLPPTFGAGVALRSHVFSVTGDWSLDMRPGRPRRHQLGGGAEALLFDLLALRAGVRHGLGEAPVSARVPATFLSGGFGLVTAGGAFGAGLERTLSRAPEWSLVTSFQLFM